MSRVNREEGGEKGRGGRRGGREEGKERRGWEGGREE